MSLSAQRPAPPPPTSKQQTRKTNLNSGIFGINNNDSNNNRQSTIFSWPTVIRPSSTTNNNTSNKQTKKKPPPRPAPPKNYHASHKPGDSLLSPPPDLLADLADIFSGPPPSQNGSRPLSYPFSQQSNQTVASAGSLFKNSGLGGSQRQQTSSHPIRPVKKYPAPVPSKNKSGGEVSLIDFDTPIGTAHLTPSDTLALAAAVNRHKSLIDWNAAPPVNQLPKNSLPFDVLDGGNWTSGALAGHHVHQQVSSLTAGTQRKENLVSWGVKSVQEQTTPREFSPPEPKFPPPPPPPMAEDDIFGGLEEPEWQHGPVLEVCEVLYEFAAEKAGDLSLRVGDRVEVEVKQNKDWWTGRCNGRSGIFPASFVRTEVPTSTPVSKEDTSGCLVKALYTFTAEQDTDLAFQEGDTVQVLYRINQDWLFGCCRGKEGQFPASFINKINANQDLYRVVYAFRAENADELSLREGDRVVVVDKSGADWWKGHLESDPSRRTGLFPAAFVELSS